MLSYNINPFELGWKLMFKMLSIVGMLLPVVPIVNHWQWITSSGVNLAITTALLIGSIIFIAQFSIAMIAATDTLDLNYTGEDVEVLNMVLIASFVIAIPIILMGGVYAHALPINEKGHYEAEKLFSFNAQKIPTLKPVA